MSLNKATSFVIVLLVILIGVLLLKKTDTTVINQIPPTEIIDKEVEPISITKVDIKETNFTGTKPSISGNSALTVEAQEFIDETIAEFKKGADEQVPSIRKEFGSDSPVSNYSIEIGAEYLAGKKTESIVITIYNYTGGAHGWSYYKAMNASRENGNILALSDVIKPDQRVNFIEFVKKELNAWNQDESSGGMVFPEDVEKLNFESLVNWSLDDQNLIIYFDQYQIGAGALGSVDFPLPLVKVQGFLN